MEKQLLANWQQFNRAPIPTRGEFPHFIKVAVVAEFFKRSFNNSSNNSTRTGGRYTNWLLLVWKSLDVRRRGFCYSCSGVVARYDMFTQKFVSNLADDIAYRCGGDLFLVVDTLFPNKRYLFRQKVNLRGNNGELCIFDWKKGDANVRRKNTGVGYFRD